MIITPIAEQIPMMANKVGVIEYLKRTAYILDIHLPEMEEIIKYNFTPGRPL